MIAKPLDGGDNTVGSVFKGMPDGAGFSKFKVQEHRLGENKVEHGPAGVQPGLVAGGVSPDGAFLLRFGLEHVLHAAAGIALDVAH